MRKITSDLSSLQLSSNFYDRVSALLQDKNSKDYALVALDFDNFNYINDFFGFSCGNEFLSCAEKQFAAMLDKDECLTRHHADLFIFLMRKQAEPEIRNHFMTASQLIKSSIKFLPETYTLVCSVGIAYVESTSESLDLLLDKANYARKEAKGNHKTNVCFYNQAMKKEQAWRKFVTSSIEEALQNRELELYLQPKVYMNTGEAVGAEALVRWNSKKHGMIYPDNFIPVLERNKFITRLDFYMLDRVCEFLKQCLENDIPVLPISINFSKLHIYDKHFIDKIYAMVNSYHLSPTLIEVEFTEYAFSENIQDFINVITNLKQLGFKVALDDFGQAYSTLNYLKDLPFDIVKIDRGFLQQTTDTDKGKVIITKVVEMLKSLRMVCVMEGVETADQASFLDRLSCDIGQGYLYAKPMPTSEYYYYLHTNPAHENSTPQSGATDTKAESQSSVLCELVPEVFQLDNWELYTLGRNVDIGMMKGHLDGQSSTHYVNDRALDYLGFTREEYHQMFSKDIVSSIIAFAHPDDAATIQENAEKLLSSEKSHEFQMRALRKDGKTILLRGRSSCVKDAQNRPIGLYTFADITEEFELKKALRLSEERCRILTEQSGNAVFDWNFETDTIRISKNCVDYFHECGRTDYVSTNAELIKKIHPNDIEVYLKWIETVYKKADPVQSVYRIRDTKGEYHWTAINSAALCNDEGIPLHAMGILSKIDSYKIEISALEHSKLDIVTHIYNKEKAQTRMESILTQNPDPPSVLLILSVNQFKSIIDTIGYQFGDALIKELCTQIKDSFHESVIVRITDDKFLILMKNCQGKESTCKKAELLLTHLCFTDVANQTVYPISANVGIAMFPEHGNTYDELLRAAEISLFLSNNQGENQVSLYDDKQTIHFTVSCAHLAQTEINQPTHSLKDLVFQIFDLLRNSSDVSGSMQSILKMIGLQFKVDGVYIFEITDDGQLMNNTYEWGAEGTCLENNHLQDLNSVKLKQFISNYHAGSSFGACNHRQTDHTAHEIPVPQANKSFLYCALINQSETRGFIGLDSCSRERVWGDDEIAAIGYISSIISLFLWKAHAPQKLEMAYENHIEMLDHLSSFI